LKGYYQIDPRFILENMDVASAGKPVVRKTRRKWTKGPQINGEYSSRNLKQNPARKKQTQVRAMPKGLSDADNNGKKK